MPHYGQVMLQLAACCFVVRCCNGTAFDHLTADPVYAATVGVVTETNAEKAIEELKAYEVSHCISLHKHPLLHSLLQRLIRDHRSFKTIYTISQMLSDCSSLLLPLDMRTVDTSFTQQLHRCDLAAASHGMAKSEFSR